MANQPENYDDMLALIEVVYQTISRQLAVLPFTAAGGRPYVEMILDNTNEFQLLTIGVDEYVIPLTNSHGIGVVDFGNNWRIRAIPINFVDGRELYMVQTTFTSTTRFRCMFSYGVSGSNGAQARLIANNEQMCLYVIDETLYSSLKRQCLTWGQFRSLTYQLIRSAHGCIVLARILFEWIGQNDVPLEVIEDLRTNIHLLGNACVDRLEHSIELDLIYKCAIVRKRSMQALIPPGGAQPPQPIDQFQVVPNLVQPQPFNGHNINVVQFQNTANNFIDNLLDHPLFDVQWYQTFGRLANANTSIPLNNNPAQYHITLTNGHEFDVEIRPDIAVIQDQVVHIFIIESEMFADSAYNIHRLRRVDDYCPPAWLAERQLLRNWMALHSHGVAGSHIDNENRNSGNNGCQVMTLRFDGIHQLAEQRLYFVNRAMAQELLNLFEVQDVMVQYYQWFQELLPLTRQLCDLRRMSREVNHDNDLELLELVNELSEQLFTIGNLLFHKYEYLVRLEQIWKYGLLVANTDHQELPVRPIITKMGIYGEGPSNRLQNFW